VLVFAAGACGEGGDAVWVDLGAREKVVWRHPEAAGPSLSCAVGAMLTPEEGRTHYGALLEHVARAVGRAARVVDRRTYAEINGELEEGKVDLAFVCSGPYVEGRRAFGLELLAVPVVDGRTTYRSNVITAAAVPAASLEELRGLSFAFTDPDSNTGHLVPVHALRELGERPETFFSRTVFSGSHDRSIEAVAGRVVDAAAVDSLVWDHAVREHPATAGLARVVWTSEPFGIPPVVVRPGLAPEFKERLRAVFLGLHDDAEGRVLLGRMGIERFVVGHDEDYDSIRAMRAALAAAGADGGRP